MLKRVHMFIRILFDNISMFLSELNSWLILMVQTNMTKLPL